MSDILREFIRESLKREMHLNEGPPMNDIINKVSDVKTIGDLKALLHKALKLKAKKQATKGVGKAVGDAVADEILGKIPGLAAAKTFAAGLAAAYNMPDKARTGSALDYLDVDDEISKIVDDRVENDFVKNAAKLFDGQPDDTPIADVNMNAGLAAYLSKFYKGRSVKGFG